MKKLRLFQDGAQLHVAGTWQHQHLYPILIHVSLSSCLLPYQTSILRWEHSCYHVGLSCEADTRSAHTGRAGQGRA